MSALSECCHTFSFFMMGPTIALIGSQHYYNVNKETIAEETIAVKMCNMIKKSVEKNHFAIIF